jgi:hypothetical protein
MASNTGALRHSSFQHSEIATPFCLPHAHCLRYVSTCPTLYLLQESVIFSDIFHSSYLIQGFVALFQSPVVELVTYALAPMADFCA